MIPATQMKVGMRIIYNGELHRVVEVQHVTPGNWRGFVQAKLQNLKTGTSLNNRFRSTDQVDVAVCEETPMEFLYEEGDLAYFMNLESYENIPINRSLLGDDEKYLKPNMQVSVAFHNHKAIGVQLPLSVELSVVQTDPPLRGATAAGGNKPAVLENGMTVKVPQHIQVGNILRVDTRDGSFIERVS